MSDEDLKANINQIYGKLEELKSGTLKEIESRLVTMHDRQNRQEGYIAQALTEIKDGKADTQEKMAEIAQSHEQKVRECLSKMSKRFDEKIEETMSHAFPGGDPHGHKMYHDAQIQWLQNRNAFFRDVLMHIAKAGIFGGLVVIGVALWKWFLIEIGKGGVP